MPAASVRALAKRAGVSQDKAERLWKRAKEKAKEQGRGEDYAYITGILKSMLGIKESEGVVESASSDSILFREVWGEDAARKIEEENMPSSVRAALLARWLEVEKQMRAMGHGGGNMDILARSLRMAVYTLLNWLAKDKQTERFKKFVGVV